MVESEPLFPRSDFPIFARTMRQGGQLVYLDSGATAQKPQSVIDAVTRQELYSNGAVARGSHELAEDSTVAFENARDKVARFINAEPGEIAWTKNSTEALNLIAYAMNNTSLGRSTADPALAKRLSVGAGDNIVATRVEHHANLIPWQELCARTGAEFRWIDLTPDGRLDLDTAGVIDSNTKVVAFTHVSNVTGAVSPVAELVELAHAVGALVVLDTCQSIPHMPVDVKALDVDFAVLSAHKLYGPTGVGALYGKRELLEAMPPFLFGGSMIEIVTMEKTTYAMPPARFEAGSQPVAQAVGLGAAIDYVESHGGMEAIAAYENDLVAYALPRIAQIPGVRVLGPVDLTDRVGPIAFDVAGVHPHDVGQVLDAHGIAVRTGHHCAQPIHKHFKVFASSRVSFAPYNTHQEIDQFLDALASVREFFGLGRPDYE
ncbi:MAG: cysteine desulfurase [Arcanobacterium sp.]|nr:cysteine desulfurase [Arcanobacterium sp.]